MRVYECEGDTDTAIAIAAISQPCIFMQIKPGACAGFVFCLGPYVFGAAYGQRAALAVLTVHHARIMPLNDRLHGRRHATCWHPDRLW